MKTWRVVGLLTALLILENTAGGQTFTNIFSFGGTNGAAPGGPLVLSNGVLYGTTALGGTNGNGGVVFSIQTNGSNFAVLHEFALAQGQTPNGTLLLLDGLLYGTTSTGGTGADTNGALFALGTTGTVFEVLTNFDQSTGIAPAGGLVSSGTNLYGVTSGGGTNGGGTVYSISSTGTDLTVLHAFPSSTNEGANPEGTLLLISNVLYGTTSAGGTNGDGTIYSVDVSGTNFVTLYSFTGTNSGAAPLGGLTDNGSTLFGVTSSGGSNDDGVIFSISTNGSNFTVWHDFGGTNGGGAPVGELVELNGTLYGLTSAGGVSNKGTVFSISTNGANFQVLTNFTGANGNAPLGSFVAGSNVLYGTTSAGGSTTNLGTIFSSTISTQAISTQTVVVCALTPTPLTNTVGDSEDIVAAITSNGTPVSGVVVSFHITTGPNAGTNGTATTGVSGLGTFTYTGAGGTGTDTILATGTVGSTIFTGTTTVVWASTSTVSALTFHVTELIEDCTDDIQVDELTATTNTVDKCNVKIGMEVTDSSASKSISIPVLVWTKQGSTFNPSLNPPLKPTKIKAGTTAKPGKVTLNLKLTGDISGTYVYITETNDTVLASIQLP